jgi:hypothetical protein
VACHGHADTQKRMDNRREFLKKAGAAIGASPLKFVRAEGA